ncbi:hypothetical protein ACIQYG_20380 [Peribacillus sp. NPDC096622]|uniref:hypothetical protein n=1 Tax=Peribacillus sp. NPDC096622 TaxID=3364396 RepID=UPI0038221C38
MNFKDKEIDTNTEDNRKNIWNKIKLFFNKFSCLKSQWLHTLTGTFLGAFLGYHFTVFISNGEAKEDYESLLKSSIYNTEMAIASVDWLMNQAEEHVLIPILY